jgi:hypothetical protein
MRRLRWCASRTPTITRALSWRGRRARLRVRGCTAGLALCAVLFVVARGKPRGRSVEESLLGCLSDRTRCRGQQRGAAGAGPRRGAVGGRGARARWGKRVAKWRSGGVAKWGGMRGKWGVSGGGCGGRREKFWVTVCARILEPRCARWGRERGESADAVRGWSEGEGRREVGGGVGVWAGAVGGGRLRGHGGFV